MLLLMSRKLALKPPGVSKVIKIIGVLALALAADISLTK